MSGVSKPRSSADGSLIAGGAARVVPYDPAWPAAFDLLRARLKDLLGPLAMRIEHVGSTSVPGLAAKPVLDVDVVIAGRDDLAACIERLALAGYRHRGDLGIAGREAFRGADEPMRHHLYVCDRGNMALRNHLVVRDHLRRHPAEAARYAELKYRLAGRCAGVDDYTAGKTEFLLDVLRRYGFGDRELEEVAAMNLASDHGATDGDSD